LDERGGNRRTGEELHDRHEQGEDRVRDDNRRDEGRHGLAEQEFLGTNRSGEYRLEGALQSLTDHRVGGEHSGHENRNGQHVDE
jgi:hypothetical protein